MQHENLSITILQQLLAKNTSVLVEFVSEGLGVEELKLIELMIKPQKEVKLSDPWKNREFLCEVRQCISIVKSALFIMTTDCC